MGMRRNADAGQGAGGEGDAGKTGDEAGAKAAEEATKKAAGAAGEDGGDADEKKAAADKARKAAEFYDTMNARYRGDPKFKEKFDRMMRGEDDEAPAKGGKEPTETEKLQAKIAELEGGLTGLQQALKDGADLSTRTGINQTYHQQFSNLASEAGYVPGSPDFNILFRNARSFGLDIAEKHGLMKENGEPDVLKAYKPKFMEEAFKMAHQEMERIGYDPKVRRAKLEMERQEADRKKKDAELDKILSPENLKGGSAARGKALQKAFNHRMREIGINPANLRLK